MRAFMRAITRAKYLTKSRWQLPMPMAIPELKELIFWWKPLLTDEYIVYMAMENFGLPKHGSWS